MTTTPRAAYTRGYTMAGANPYQGAAPGRLASAEHVAFELGRADRESGRPARPEAGDKPARLAALLAAARQGNLLAPVERQSVEDQVKGSLL